MILWLYLEYLRCIRFIIASYKWRVDLETAVMNCRSPENSSTHCMPTLRFKCDFDLRSCMSITSCLPTSSAGGSRMEALVSFCKRPVHNECNYHGWIWLGQYLVRKHWHQGTGRVLVAPLDGCRSSGWQDRCGGRSRVGSVHAVLGLHVRKRLGLIRVGRVVGTMRIVGEGSR